VTNGADREYQGTSLPFPVPLNWIVRATLDSFDDTRRLDEPALRDLLDHGRPEERVWAIWALALRSADVGDLARRDEPDPGVRRSLAIVLAGHGHLDLLTQLARRDPAPEVRAAATRLLSRLAIDGAVAPALVLERAADDGVETRIAVLGTIFERAPTWLVELATRLLDDRDADVRYEAFEALVRAEHAAPALVWLEESPEAEARLSLVRFAARGRARACAELVASSSRRLRRLLIESVRVATWRDLEPAIGDDPALLRALARKNPGVLDEMPLDQLLAATLRDPSDASLLRVRDRLAALDHPDELAPLVHDYREVVAHRIAELDRRIHELRGRGGDRADGELYTLQEDRAELEHAYERASRLLVH
jgi:hypothetical protein